MCRRKRLDRERSFREREALFNLETSERIRTRFLEQAPEVTPEPVLWDAAAEINLYIDTESERFTEYDYFEAGGYGPIREPVTIHLPGTSEEERFIAMNPSSSSAAAGSYFVEEPDPEPDPDFGTETPS
jgi:hypothetical protein